MNAKLSVMVLLVLGVATLGRGEVLRVVREPRLVPSVSSKTEHGWVKCRWCNGKIGYDRTYRWDPYDRVWIETTKEVPTSCRKCKSRDEEVARLRREEANLDRKLELKETRKRVAEKRERLRNWSAENR